MNRLAALVLLVLLVLPAGLARADGDPPSDVLISQNVYYPYSPPVSAAVQKVLTKATADAKRAGYPIRVAIVAGRNDLGSVPTLFGQPQRYAKFLQSEITFNKPRPLLTVMPAGYGWVEAGPKADAVMKSLPAPGLVSDSLAQGAAAAVAKLAAGAGHPIPTPATVSVPGSGSKKSKSSTPWWVFVVPLVLVGLAVALLSQRSGGDDDTGEAGDAGQPAP
jgi:hypothetical protein